MSQNDHIPVTVRIMDREYQISCAPEEKQPLLDSARYLDSKMKEVRGDRRIVGTDRIAVMAALNITNELLQNRLGGDGNQKSDISSKQLANLQQKLEMALNRAKQAEMAL